MAKYINKVQLLGNLGADPEVRHFQNGGRVLSFNLATSESWKDRDSGERKERTTWHRVSIFADTFVAGRSDMAVVRSLRDNRRQCVAVRTLQLHDDHGLAKEPTRYPSLPDPRFYRRQDRASRLMRRAA